MLYWFWLSSGSVLASAGSVLVLFWFLVQEFPGDSRNSCSCEVDQLSEWVKWATWEWAGGQTGGRICRARRLQQHERETFSGGSIVYNHTRRNHHMVLRKAQRRGHLPQARRSNSLKPRGRGKRGEDTTGDRSNRKAKGDLMLWKSLQIRTAGSLG